MSILSFKNARKGREKGSPNCASRLAMGVAAVAAAVTIALGGGATQAQAATSGAEYPSAVIDTVSPSGTTINLYDYWISSQTSYSTVTGDNNGINSGHQLKFNTGSGSGINRWSGTNGLPTNFVQKTLNAAGYPQIAADTYTVNGTSSKVTTESLAYLFDDSTVSGKQAYNNVQGLLKSENGYYVYDATANFAVFNSDENAFDVYNAAAVHKGSSTGTVGQFFPFNKASDVFTYNSRTQTVSANTMNDSNTSTLNHHFGLSLTTDFTQPVNGKVTYEGTSEDMTFEFSGDDDVWVYVDGVLVGDLGGIHDSDSLSINFATGAVRVYSTAKTSSSTSTTIKACFEAAGKTSDTQWNGNTFAAGTNHKLSFFYLERGAGASNMKIKYNLYNQPTSEVNKVDQAGYAVEGASFSLYSADANYNKQSLLASGTTDSDGKLIFTKSDGSIVSFDDEYASGTSYYVLVENEVPDGYRTGLSNTDSEMHFYYQPANQNNTGGALVAETVQGDDGIYMSRMMLNGTYLSAKETLILKDSETAYADGSGTFKTNSGITFAVVVKNSKVGDSSSATDASCWNPIVGTATTGYSTLSETGAAGAIAAAKQNKYGIFAAGSTGEMMTELTELPGDVSRYAGMMSDSDIAAGNEQYGVVVYHTTASSLDQATADNTKLVNTTAPKRTFAVVANITNVKNHLWVQKVDSDGNAIAGAEFALYTADSVNVNADGTYTVKNGAKPYDTITTKDQEIIYGLKGAAVFPDDADNKAALKEGTYYLFETSAPDGYSVNTNGTKVIIDSTGVHVDAGTENDGIKSMVSPGALMTTLNQFGDNQMDTTLHTVKGTLQTGTLSDDGTITWGATDASTTISGIHFPSYGQGQLNYVDANGNLPILYSDTGITRMLIQQDLQGESKPDNMSLGTTTLNQLFTNSTGVQYTDERVARLEVTKEVAKDESASDETDLSASTFTFKFTLPTNGIFNSQEYEAQVFEADGTKAGDSFKLKNGDTHTVTAGQTIKVYGLSEGDAYTVQEVTTSSTMPKGFKLTSRTAGGTEVEGQGDSITGTIEKTADDQAAKNNQLVFTNTYSASEVTLKEADGGPSAKKVISGTTDWTGTYTFRLHGTTEDTPMPEGSTKSSDGKTYVKDVTVSSTAASYFGDITFSKPGTYVYSVTEVVPEAADMVDGISYSGARYIVSVVVEDNGEGALQIKSSTMTRALDDSGAPATGDVDDHVATFTNSYDEYKASVSLKANKRVDSNYGNAYTVNADDYTFQLEAVGGYTSSDATVSYGTWTGIDADDVPVAETMTATNDASADIAFEAIEFTAKENAGNTYVYKMTEVEPETGAAGMEYDNTVYYAVVRTEWNNQGIKVSSPEYYEYNEVYGTLTKLAFAPTFVNTYTPEAVTVAQLQGQKTLTGRNWTEDDSFSYTITAADSDTRQAIAMEHIQNWDGIAATASVDEETEGTVDFGFTTTGEDNTLTIDKVGTYTFNVNETKGSATGVFYDTHTSKVTITVTDNQETGKLEAAVAYNNIAATTASDRAVTTGVAFTNNYTAASDDTTYAGVDVSKIMRGKSLAGNDFLFNVTALNDDTTVPTEESAVKNPAADEGSKAHLTYTDASGSHKLFYDQFDQSDLGHTYAYRLSEDHGKDGSGYKYDTLNNGDAFVFVQPYASDTATNADGSAKIYARVYVLKGEAVETAFENTYGSDAAALLDDFSNFEGLENVLAQTWDTATDGTPSFDFVNEYSSSIDYVAQGGFKLIKQVLNGGNTVGSPSSKFTIQIMPIESKNEDGSVSTTAAESAAKLSIAESGRVFDTAQVEGYYDENADDPKASGYWERNVLTGISTLKFDQTDAGKTYSLTYQELATDGNGWDYDNQVYTISVSFEDNGNGTMTATTTVKNAAGEVQGTWEYTTGETADSVAQGVIKNKYTAEATNSKVTPTITKVVTGLTSTAEQFTFNMVAADDATKAAIDAGYITNAKGSADNYTESVTASVTDVAGTQVKFSDLTFNKVGTYKFNVTEVEPASKTDKMHYDSHTYTLTVDVVDVNGVLYATTQSSTEQGGSVFTNAYSTSNTYGATGGLDIVKNLTGRYQAAGDFTFTIHPNNSYAQEKLGSNDITVTNNAAAAEDSDKGYTSSSVTAVLDTLSLGTTDQGRVIELKISENAKDGYTNDTGYWIVKITPYSSDDGQTISSQTIVEKYNANGTAIADTKVIYNQNDGEASKNVTAKISFDNTYEGEVVINDPDDQTSAKIAAKKFLEGAGANDLSEADRTFTFYAAVEKNDGSYVVIPNSTTSVVAAPNSVDGNAIQFSKMTFSIDDATDGKISLSKLVQQSVATRTLNSDGTIDYQITGVVIEDVSSLADGVYPDRAQPIRTFQLKITDDGKGNLSAAITYPSGVDSLDFYNYKDKVKTVSTVENPTVDIDGKLLSVGDTYTYTINWANNATDESGNMTVADVVVTDTLPEGTEFVDASGNYSLVDGKLTWNLGEQRAASHGTVTVTVRISDDAAFLNVDDSNIATIVNEASVKVGENDPYTGTTTNYVSVKTENDGSSQYVGIGDEITYTIGYKNTEIGFADITVTDVVPAGTEFVRVESQGGVYDPDTNTITWKLLNVPVNTENILRFTVKVAESAFTYDEINNTASVKIGDDDPVQTTSVSNVPDNDASLAISKVVNSTVSNGDVVKLGAHYENMTETSANVSVYASVPEGTEFVSADDDVEPVADQLTWNLGSVDEWTSENKYFTVRVTDASKFDIANPGTGSYTVNGVSAETTLSAEQTSASVVAPDKEFTFKFQAWTSEAKTTELTGEYTYVDVNYVEQTIKSGDTFTLTDKTGITINGLPKGAYYEVSEQDLPDGFTVNQQSFSGVIGTNGYEGVTFENVYNVEQVELEGEDAFNEQTTIEGRDWNDDDSFTVELSGKDNAPMPEGAADGKLNLTNTNEVEQAFGDITYTIPGTYTYELRELSASEAGTVEQSDGMHYSEAKYTVTVTVTDNGDGSMNVNSVMIQTADDNGNDVYKVIEDDTALFVNTYTKMKTVGTVDSPTVDVDGQPLGVGDEYTYTINWSNNTGEAADVTVTDTIPDGTEFVDASGNVTPVDGVITWNLGEQANLATGSVTVTVKITDAAASVDTVNNTASITVGEHQYNTNTVTNTVPKKTVSGVDQVDGTAKVGDVLTYNISFTVAKDEKVSVYDQIPEGTEFVAFGTDQQSASGTVTDGYAYWYFDGLAAGTNVNLSFQVRVTDAALTVDSVKNTATVNLNGDPAIQTNTVETELNTGSLTVSKEISGGDSEAEFSFTIALRDTSDNAISGTFKCGDDDVVFTNGEGTITVKAGESKTVTGLPEGAKYTVTEAAASGYTAYVGDTKTNVAEGTIVKDAEGVESASVSFTNKYGEDGSVDYNTDTLFTKALNGRDWMESDSFEFTIEAAENSPEGTPMPASTTKTLTATAKADEQVRFGFGDITYDFDDLADAKWTTDASGNRIRVKTFTYTVSEVVPEAAKKIAGVTYDTHKATFVVTVTDDGTGDLKTKGAVTSVVTSGDFVNKYEADLDYDALGGIKLSKTLTGHSIAANQFSWKLYPGDDESAALFGINGDYATFVSTAASASVQDDDTVSATCTVDMVPAAGIKLTQLNAGKTYRYTLVEDNDAKDGYVYDGTQYNITIQVKDNGDATLTAVTTVENDNTGEKETYSYTTGKETEKAAVVSFTNQYQAEGELGGDADVKVNAIKELTGRPVEEGEFSFQIVENAGTDDEEVLANGTNDANGNISFDQIHYDQDDLEGASSKTFYYTVRELTDDEHMPAGTEAVVSEFTIAVKVTDDNAGKLNVEVGYPAGTNSLTFKNTYGASAKVELPMSGSKELKVDAKLAETAPSIEGAFTFTLTGEDGAPMPEGAVDGVLTTTNTNGSVVFGNVTYTMENVFGTTAASEDEPSVTSTVREKTFTYTVAETDGAVDGVTRDDTTYTITVTVTDNGDGTLSAVTKVNGEVVENGAQKFQFVNEYTTKPVEFSVTDEGNLNVNKSIKNRELVAGEFEFEMLEVVNPETGEAKVVSTGTNDADGKVTMDSVEYTEPGTHTYMLSENGEDGTDGVTFDHHGYFIQVDVKDNGKGQLVASATLLDPDTMKPTEKDTISFVNTYETNDANVKIVASKKLDGGTLAEGQFKFELVDENGNVLQTKSNSADGKVQFDALTYTVADAGKTYTYKVREVNDGQSGVTYDTTERTITVTLSDDGKGQLDAETTGLESLTFTNKVAQTPVTPTPTPTPSTPETPKKTIPATGDVASFASVGALAASGVIALIASKKRK